MAEATAARPAAMRLSLLLPGALFLLVLPTNHTMALRMLLLLATLAAALFSTRKYGMPRVPIRGPLIAWVMLALLSVTWSEQPAFSLAEIKTEIGYGMAAFFGFFVLTHSRRELRLWIHMAVAALATTLVVVIVGLWRSSSGSDPWDVVHGYASYSTYLVTAAPIVLLWFAIATRGWRVAGWALAPAYLWVAYLLGNRMFWISLLGVFAVHALLSAWRGSSRPAVRRRVLSSVAGMLLCVLLFVVVASQKPVDYTSTAPRDASVSAHMVNTFTQSERLYMWSFWADRIAERPWTGVGFGRDLPHWVYEKPKEWPHLYFAHAHNLILDYGVQMGIPGILTLFWLFGAIAVCFWRFVRSSDEMLHLVGAAGLALVLAVFSKNMADELFWRTDALVFWTFTGILLGYGTRRASDLAAQSAPLEDLNTRSCP